MTTRLESACLSHRSRFHLSRDDFATDPTKKEQSVAQALSVGVRTRAASTWNPRAWAYSRNTSLKRGAVCSAATTIDFILSGITTGKTPPKKPQAASKPRMTSAVVWENVGQTKE